MIDRSLLYSLMIIFSISSFPVISTLQLPQNVMAHITPYEGTKVPGNDVTPSNVHSSILNQVMLVLAVTVIITVMVARVQQALAVKGLGEFSRVRDAGQVAGKNAAMSGMSYEAPLGHTAEWIAGYHIGYNEGYTTAKKFQNIR